MTYGERGEHYLDDNEYVVFEDGQKLTSVTGARYSLKEKAFWTFKCDKDGEYIEDEYEHRIKIYSNDVRVKAKRKSNKGNYKKQTDTSKMTVIKVDHETPKAYAVYEGSNGLITHPVHYYKYVAKSICVVKDGIVYAPVWAI